jgi:hypothetical protein
VEKTIQECAVRLHALLAGRGEVNILRLAEMLAERSHVTYQALGWLAREGRVRYRQQGSQVLVAAVDGPGSTADAAS